MKNFDKMSELTGLNIKELKKEGEKYSLVQYFLDGPTYNENWLKEKGVHALESAYNLQRLIKHISRHASLGTDIGFSTVSPLPRDVQLTDGKMLKEIGPTPTFPDLFPDLAKGKFCFDLKWFLWNERVFKILWFTLTLTMAMS